MFSPCSSPVSSDREHVSDGFSIVVCVAVKAHRHVQELTIDENVVTVSHEWLTIDTFENIWSHLGGTSSSSSSSSSCGFGIDCLPEVCSCCAV